jgi:putative ABC transport system permease protein
LTVLYLHILPLSLSDIRGFAEAYAAAAVVSMRTRSHRFHAAVAGAAALSPAVAMQPPAPPSYRRFWSGRLQPLKYLSQLTIMVLRHILRWPIRSLLQLGISSQ